VDRVRVELLAHLREERIEPPARDRIRRVIVPVVRAQLPQVSEQRCYRFTSCIRHARASRPRLGVQSVSVGHCWGTGQRKAATSGVGAKPSNSGAAGSRTPTWTTSVDLVGPAPGDQNH
jgi:hypothetical protein